MIFLNPLLLWGLLAAAIPVLIHLMNKRRHKTLPWAATRFLHRATQESRGKKKLRDLSILTCRALAIATLALAAARPVISAIAGWTGGSVDTVVLLLDRSSSMEIQTADGLQPRRKVVIEKVRHAMANLGASRLVLIDSASNEVQEVPSPDTLSEINSTAASDTTADFPDLMIRAAEFLSTSSGRSEIWLASDLQSSDWHPNDPRWAAARTSLAALHQKPAIRVLSLTGPTAPNSAIHLLESRRSGDGLTLDLEIIRAPDSQATLNVPLSIHLNHATTTENLTIPGQSVRFQKRIALPAGNLTGFGWLSIPADGNARDNSAYFAYGPAVPAHSVVVAPNGEAADVLALAAAPPGYENQIVRRLEPSDAATLETSGVSTILWSAPLPIGHTAEKISQFVSTGGQVIFFPPADGSTNSFRDLTWLPPSSSDADKFFTLKDWNHRDGPLRDGIDGNPIPAQRLKAFRRQIPSGGGTALSRWDDEEPFITRSIDGRGTLWFVGSLPDYTWSNLGDADVLLPMVQRIITAGTERFSMSYHAEVGSETANPRPGESHVRLDSNATSNHSNPRDQAGVFRIGDRLVASNRPIEEDSPEILTRDQLDQIFVGTNYTLLERVGKSNDTAVSSDAWRAFLVAMIVLLISEAILCLPKHAPDDKPTGAHPKSRLTESA